MPEICRQGDNTCNIRKVPIIFAPGVMGTRLHFPDAGQDWDPNSSWAMAHWIHVSAEKMRQEIRFNQTAEVMLDYDGSDSKQKDRGWGGPVKDFYRGFLQFLEGLSSSLCATCPVYAHGYDWRKSNKESGMTLDSKITDVLNKENATNFILITHSMGGLVARSCLSGSANASKCLGVVHITQPAQGAVKFYAMMYTGAVLGVDTQGTGTKDKLLVKIQGDNPKSFATILSGLRGPCELIPTNDYENPGGGPWLWDDRTPPSPGPPFPFPPPVFPSGGAPWPSPVFRWYLDPSSPPNVFWSVAGLKTKFKPTPEDDLKTRMHESNMFHVGLGMWKHPNTWSIYSTNLATDTSTRFNNFSKMPNGVNRVRPNFGDATVPAGSASSLFAASQTSRDETGDELIMKPGLRQCEVKDVEHGAACNSSKVQTIVNKMLLLTLGCIAIADDGTDTGETGPLLASDEGEDSDSTAENTSDRARPDDDTDSASDGTVASNSDSASSNDYPPDPSDWNTDDDGSATA